MKDVLISLDEGLWQRTKGLALVEHRPVKELVANALRLYLSRGEASGGMVGVDEGPSLAGAECCGVASSDPVGLTKARVLAALGGAVVTGTALRAGARPTSVGVGGSTRGGPAPEAEGARMGATPREVERERVARQDYLRTHPEEDSQDDPLGLGF